MEAIIYLINLKIGVINLQKNITFAAALKQGIHFN